MKFGPVVVIALLAAAVTNAEPTLPVGTCDEGAFAIPTFDPDAQSGTLGDYFIVCHNFTNVGIGHVNFRFFFNVSDLMPPSGFLTPDPSTYYPGTGSGNTLAFSNIPYDTSQPTQFFILIDVPVRPNVWGAPFNFYATVLITGDLDLAINGDDITQLVGMTAAPEPDTLLLASSTLAFLGLIAVYRRRSTPTHAGR